MPSLTCRLADLGVTLGASFARGGQGDIFTATGPDGAVLAVKRRKDQVSLDRFCREIDTMRNLADRGCDVIPLVVGFVVDGDRALLADLGLAFDPADAANRLTDRFE